VSPSASDNPTLSPPPVPVPIEITSGGTLVRDPDGNVTVTGVGPPGSVIDVYVDGGAQPVATVTVNNQGDWTATFPISPGSHTIRAVGSGGGQASQSVTVVDAQASDTGSLAGPR
jgi:hypothetical protein